MGRRIEETFHLDRKGADEAQEARGILGYSEVYPRGVFPCKIVHPETGEVVDGWKSVTETFYG
jgi:hypothetical protein